MQASNLECWGAHALRVAQQGDLVDIEDPMVIAGFTRFDGKAGSCHQKEKAQQVARMRGGRAHVHSVHL